MNNNISQAIILAAGFGKRMLPLTKKIPKPLIKINNKPIIYYILEELRNNSIFTCYINVHYLPEKIIEYIKYYSKLHNYMNINIVKEKNILDTGGGIKNIFNTNNNIKPTIVINGDSIIISNQNTTPLKELINNFNEKTMNFLLLLDDKTSSIGYTGTGDFKILKTNSPSIIQRSNVNSFAYTGWQIVNPVPIIKIKNKNFSLNYCYDKAIKNNLLWGIRNKNKWLHVGNKPSLLEATQWINDNKDE